MLKYFDWKKLLNYPKNCFNTNVNVTEWSNTKITEIWEILFVWSRKLFIQSLNIVYQSIKNSTIDTKAAYKNITSKILLTQYLAGNDWANYHSAFFPFFIRTSESFVYCPSFTQELHIYWLICSHFNHFMFYEGKFLKCNSSLPAPSNICLENESIKLIRLNCFWKLW